MEMQQTMKSEMESVVADMLRFAELLRMTYLPRYLADDYAAWGRKLQSDSSPQTVQEAQEWVGPTLRGGMGGLGDHYVYRADGTYDDALSDEYMEVLGRLYIFVHPEYGKS